MTFKAIPEAEDDTSTSRMNDHGDGWEVVIAGPQYESMARCYNACKGDSGNTYNEALADCLEIAWQYARGIRVASIGGIANDIVADIQALKKAGVS
ncbi:hypothetical protein N9104_01675 [Pseudomonadales bacterium]|nr:hypothetical protein [Pseudomonadales bacterium]